MSFFPRKTSQLLETHYILVKFLPVKIVDFIDGVNEIEGDKGEYAEGHTKCYPRHNGNHISNKLSVMTEKNVLAYNLSFVP